MKRIFGVLSVLLLIFAFPTVVAASSDSTMPQINRLAGLDRYETSAKVAQSGWTQSNFAVLVTGENYPDALCAAPLAKRLQAPILLTSKDSLSWEAESELDRLGVKTVYIVGGPGAISMNVENALREKGVSIYRVFGDDRYLTSVQVAFKATADRERLDEVILTTGEDFADAVSVSSIAAKKGIPIILVPKDYDSNIMKNIMMYLNSKNITKTYIIGGTDIISDEVAKQFPGTIRITGKDKYERNVAIINKFMGDLDFSTTYLATGEDFPDALTGAAIAAGSSSPLILVRNDLPSVTKSLLDSKLSTIKQFNVLGGEGVVPGALLQNITSSTSQPSNNAGNTTVNTQGNSAGNIASRGTAARQGGWIYYIDDYSSKGALYKIRDDGTGKLKITDDRVDFINVMGDWIYYSNDSDQGKIYKIRTDATDKVKISDDSAYYLTVLDDWIYYSNESEGFSLYKVKVDGSQRTSISADSAFYLNVVGENIYYLNADDFAIYRISTNGNGQIKVVSDQCGVLNVVNETIYYRNFSDHRRLYSIHVDGTGKTKISDDNAMVINSDENWIYYTNASDNTYLYKIRFDGTGRTRLNTHSSIQLSIIGDWVYYINDYPSGTQIYKTRIDGSEDKLVE